MISVDSVTVEFNGQALFSNITFNINENDRIALMGKNGAVNHFIKNHCEVNKPCQENIGPLKKP